jgi:hypothetical protein
MTVDPGSFPVCCYCGEPIAREAPWMTPDGPAHLRCVAVRDEERDG